jgi:hypothetical protein
MIRKTPQAEEFWRNLAKQEDLSYEEAAHIYDALHQEAVALGAISADNIWDGIEVDLRITKAMGRLKRGREANQTNRPAVGPR